MLIAFSAITFQSARNTYIASIQIEEVQVRAERRPEYGTYEFRISECRHIIWRNGIIGGQHLIGHLPEFLDCRDEAYKSTGMLRKDI